MIILRIIYIKNMNCYNCGKTGHTKRECYSQSSNLIECYDCHEKVQALDDHRKICSKSRKAKSIINSNKTIEPILSIKKLNNQQRLDEVDTFFLLDVSGSMLGNKLEKAKSVLLQLSDILKHGDRISIISFDTNAYYKLKLHPIKKVSHEIPDILNGIFAEGGTALYDAIHLAVNQIKNKNNKSIIYVLTDGQDNSSKHSYQSTLDLVKEYPNLHLHIIHIDNMSNNIEYYNNLCNVTRGKYYIINDSQITTLYKEIIIETIVQIKTQVKIITT